MANYSREWTIEDRNRILAEFQAGKTKINCPTPGCPGKVVINQAKGFDETAYYPITAECRDGTCGNKAVLNPPERYPGSVDFGD